MSCQSPIIEVDTYNFHIGVFHLSLWKLIQFAHCGSPAAVFSFSNIVEKNFVNCSTIVTLPCFRPSGRIQLYQTKTMKVLPSLHWDLVVCHLLLKLGLWRNWAIYNLLLSEKFLYTLVSVKLCSSLALRVHPSFFIFRNRLCSFSHPHLFPLHTPC